MFLTQGSNPDLLHCRQILYCLRHQGSHSIDYMDLCQQNDVSAFTHCSLGWSVSQSVQLFRGVQFFATPWTAARQASLSITNSWSVANLMSIELVMPSNYLILYHLLLLPSIFPSIRVFSNESVLRIRWPKYWSFSFNISPSNEHWGGTEHSFKAFYIYLICTVTL